MTCLSNAYWKATSCGWFDSAWSSGFPPLGITGNFCWEYVGSLLVITTWKVIHIEMKFSCMFQFNVWPSVNFVHDLSVLKLSMVKHSTKILWYWWNVYGKRMPILSWGIVLLQLNRYQSWVANRNVICFRYICCSLCGHAQILGQISVPECKGSSLSNACVCLQEVQASDTFKGYLFSVQANLSSTPSLDFCMSVEQEVV